jgi:hypothetical protein
MSYNKEYQSMEPTKLDSMLEILKANSQNYLLPGASEQEIAALEKGIGRDLPPSYHRFLRMTNGAILYQTEEMLGTKTDKEVLQFGIGEVIRSHGGDLPQNLMPFNKSNVFLYFDTDQLDKNNGESAVVKWYPETNENVKIANSFTDWLEDYVINEYE